MNLDDLKRGASIPCEDGPSCDARPPWLDMERFRRGQEFFQRHIVICTFAMHCSLVVGFSLINLLDALVFTNMSDTPSKALPRYLDTLFHIIRWHTGDVWNNPSDPAYKSVRSVRKMHNRVANDMNKGQRTKSDMPYRPKSNQNQISQRKRKENDGDRAGRSKGGGTPLWFSQYDMGLVQCGFMGAIVMYPHKFGCNMTRSELEDYIHFWRGIGHILGVTDSFNICRGDYRQTVSICKQIEDEVLIPGLQNPPANFARMADAYCDGVSRFVGIPLYTKEAVTALVYNGMDRPVGQLSLADKVRVWLYKLFLCLISWCPGFERLLNWRIMNRVKGIFQKSAQKKREEINTRKVTATNCHTR